MDDVSLCDSRQTAECSADTRISAVAIRRDREAVFVQRDLCLLMCRPDVYCLLKGGNLKQDHAHGGVLNIHDP